MLVGFLLGVAVGFILGLVFVAITAGTFARRRPERPRVWPKPPGKGGDSQ